MNKKWKLYVVPHTHWDKEWYFTKQDSDVLLVNNIKDMIVALSANTKWKSFVYDGQASTIEDYLLYHPHDIKIISQLIKTQKLVVGPWYTQPDFFNTTSESLVRNLLIGMLLSESWGYSQKIAYVPDSFGHNSQMPQIYRLFNLNAFLYWRGIDLRLIEKSLLHYWEGVDGTKILSENLLYGYWSFGACFPYFELNNNNLVAQAQLFLKKTKDLISELKNHSQINTDKLLIPLGGDQGPFTLLIPEFIAQCNELDQENEWILSNYDEYFNLLTSKSFLKQLPVIKGELKTPAFARIHKTIASQRVDIKQLMKETEYLVYNQLEPLAVINYIIGLDYPQEVINNIIKKILMSQAHDSLGGCNSDETNNDIYLRLSQAQQLSLSLITKLMKLLLNNILIKHEENNEQTTSSLLIFNSLAITRNYNLQCEIFTSLPSFTIKYNDYNIEYDLQEQVKVQGGCTVGANVHGESEQQNESYYRTKIILHLTDLVAFGYQLLTIVEHDMPFISEQLIIKKTFANKFWKGKINENGTLELQHLSSGFFFHDQFVVQAVHDSGDSYDFSPFSNHDQTISKIITSNSEIKELSAGGIEINLTNTYYLSEKKLQQTFTFKIYLAPNSEIINLEISTNNSSKEVKWVLLINSAIYHSEFSYANQAFCEEKRLVSIKENDELSSDSWKKLQWKEKPIEIETNESYVYLQDKNYKVGVITCGNNEYQILGQDKEIIGLTLFRAIGYLGLDNLVYRPGRASGTADFLFPTENAFLQKPLSFKLAFFVTEKQNSIWHISENYLTKPIYYQSQKHNQYFKRFDRFLLAEKESNVSLDKTNSFLTIDNINVIVKSIKKAEQRQGIILRLFNSTNEMQTFSLSGIKNVAIVNLKEEIIKQNIFDLTFTIKPYQIISFLCGIVK